MKKNKIYLIIIIFFIILAVIFTGLALIEKGEYENKKEEVWNTALELFRVNQEITMMEE